LPRSLFNNDFEKLIDELEELDFILRAFSELAIGSAETIEVHQISTSDPQFFFGLSAVTIAAIGTAVTWALNTWKQVEDVRRVRAETRKLSAFSEKEVDDIFDKKIKSIIGTAIEAQTKILLSDTSTRGGRVYEQGEHLKRALESILARVERGMTVEIRALPPPKGSAMLEARPAETAAFEALKTIAPNLFFPKPDQHPILPLPAPDREKRS
jgi:hypothetical protein